MPESLRSSCTSSRRHGVPLMAYSEPPERNMVRLIVTSAYSIGSAPSLLSMVRRTSARPSGGRPEVPAKMTSSILPPRRLLAPCSPITQARASTTLDLPEPLGPTMHVTPGSSWSVVDEAKDLNPFRVRLFRYNVAPHIDGTAARSRPLVSRVQLQARGGRAGEVQRGHPTQGRGSSRATGAVSGPALDQPSISRRPASASAQPLAQHHQLLTLPVCQGVDPARADLVEQRVEGGLVGRDRRRRQRLPGPPLAVILAGGASRAAWWAEPGGVAGGCQGPDATVGPAAARGRR